MIRRIYNYEKGKEEEKAGYVPATEGGGGVGKVYPTGTLPTVVSEKVGRFKTTRIAKVTSSSDVAHNNLAAFLMWSLNRDSLDVLERNSLPDLLENGGLLGVVDLSVNSSLD